MGGKIGGDGGVSGISIFGILGFGILKLGGDISVNVVLFKMIHQFNRRIS